MDQTKLKEFKRGHWEDAAYEVLTKLAKWLGRISCLKEKINARTDARRTIRHDISSTGLQPVELKIAYAFCNNVYKSRLCMWERLINNFVFPSLVQSKDITLYIHAAEKLENI